MEMAEETQKIANTLDFLYVWEAFSGGAFHRRLLPSHLLGFIYFPTSLAN